MASEATAPCVLGPEQWQARAAAHQARVEPWIREHQQRRAAGTKHPVWDFLFEYYRVKRHILAAWHPPLGVAVTGPGSDQWLRFAEFARTPSGVQLQPCLDDARLRERFRWVRTLLERALERDAQFSCFGLHEWAMVYRTEHIRHATTPLRVSPAEVADVVESQPIRCSHLDAYRFFTEAARPLNQLQPSQDTRHTFEQFGCVHFNMDLYKWCAKLHPWVSSELTADCFALAREARVLDMRASPYDVRAYGHSPICIETPEGRRAYQHQQQALSLKGRALAQRLLAEVQGLG